VSLIFILIFSAGIAYHFFEQLNLFESVYMVVITLTTTGYGDLVPKTTMGRVLALVVLFVGIAIASYTLTLITKLIIEGELRRTLGRRKLEKFVKQLHDHVIICGYGRVGMVITRQLIERKIDFVVIEKDEATFALLEDNEILGVFGDASSDEILKKANIDKARSLIAVTKNDPDNLFITISARQLNPSLYIIARSTDETIEEKFLRAGANKVICPYRLGAMQMTQSALRPNVIDFIEIAAHRQNIEYNLEEIKVCEASEVCNRTLEELALPKTAGVIIVGIRRDEKMMFNPSASTAIQPNDILIALGDPVQLSTLEKIVTGKQEH
jgi:voltage-gated potassium channel